MSRSRARMLKRLVASCAVVCALTVVAPAHASVFPFLQPPERLDAPIGQVVALDFDGNGWVDVAGVSGLPDNASLVLNGENGFGEPQTTEIDDGSRSVAASAAAGDLDGDGRDELIASTGEGGSLVIFKGRASGGLGTPEVLSLRAWADSRGTLLGVADLDGDGDLDVVAAWGESATVLVNDGDGALTPSAGAVTLPSYLSELKLVKLAGDADPDLVVIGGYTLAVLPGAAGAGFGTPVNYPIDAQGAALAASDVNRDGRPDLSVVYDSLQWGAQTPGVFMGTADAGLAPVPGGAQVGSALALAEFDGDGATDRYAVGYRSVFAHGAATGGWLAQAESEQAFSENDLATADFDHDGRLDVASVMNYPRAILIRYWSGPQLVPGDANTWFGDGTVNAGNAMYAVPVRNEGGGVARNLELVIEGDTDDFEVDLDTCRGAVLPVDGQCWINVYFRPKTLGDRAVDIGMVAEDSSIVWMVTFEGTGQPAPPPGDGGNPGPTTILLDRTQRPAPPTRPTRPTRPTPKAAVRPAAAKVTRSTLASLRRSGLRFTQQFGTAERVTWTLEHRGTVLARARRTVTVGRTSVTLKLTAAGKRVLGKRKPTTLTLRTKGTLERVTTVKLRRG
jgi:hypothetical protein